MITAEIIVGFDFTPRDAHRRDQRALKRFVFMGEQDAAAQPIHVTAVGCVLAEIIVRIDHGALPLAHIGLPMHLKGIRQRLH